MKLDEEYWYMKGVEDFGAFLTDSLQEEQKESNRLVMNAISNQLRRNIKLIKELQKRDFEIVSGGTDNHLILVDLQKQNVSGKIAAEALEVAGIVLNYNLVPYDPMPPFYTSGIRMGTPAITTRGMKEKHMAQIAEWIKQGVEEVKGYTLPTDKAERSALLHTFRKEVGKNKKLLAISKDVSRFASTFPLP